MQALPRFIDILNAGIIVATLQDNQVYSKESIDENPYQIMVSLGPMIRSHEESAVKSKRVSDAWAKKREAARAGTHKLTRRTPSWIVLKDGEFIIQEDQARIVRRIFDETISGHGRRTIAVRLNMENVPTFRAHENRKVKPTGWQASSIAKVLNSRAVFGEFQPGTGTRKYGTHKPEGDPIKGYYPAVVDETTFWLAQRIIASRRSERDENGVTILRGKGGRRGHEVAHLIMGLGKCSRCKGPMHIINKGRPPKGGLYLECSTARRKAGCDNNMRWRVDAIERRLLLHLPYIDTDAVLGGGAHPSEAERVEALKARMSDVQKRTRNRAAMLEAADELDEDSLARHRELLTELSALKSDLAKAEEALAQAAADPGLRTRLADTIELSRAMDEAEGEERMTIRTRLSEQLRQLVDYIDFDHRIGALAFLKARPGIPSDQVPWIYGTRNRAPWLLWLDDDDDPHGDIYWGPGEDPNYEPSPLPATLFSKRIRE